MRQTTDEKIFRTVGGVFILLFSVICLLPFVMMLSGSLSSEELIKKNGYSLLPQGFTFEAYRVMFSGQTSIPRAYCVTICVTALAIMISLTFNSMAAYALSRKEFRWRNNFALFFYFTCLFSGGMVPNYILRVSLGLRNNPLILVIGYVFSVWNTFLIRNYMSSLPDSLDESAKIDGANDFTVYSRVVLPLCTPVIATIALFTGLGAWNSWYTAMLYLSDKKLYPLQYVLYQLINSQKARQIMMEKGAAVDMSEMMKMPDETLKLATTMIVTGPIIFSYPFVQKYFVKGITVGAVKG